VEFSASGNFLFNVSKSKVKKEVTLVIRVTKTPKEIKKNFGVIAVFCVDVSIPLEAGLGRYHS